MTSFGRLVLIALAIGAISAAIAPATAMAGKLGSAEGYPARLTGSQVGEIIQKWENDTIENKCPVGLFLGQIAGESANVSGVEGEYRSEGETPCTFFGGAAPIRMNGGAPKNKKGEANPPCTYTYTIEAAVIKEMEFSGTMDIVCPTVENEAGGSVEQKITVNFLSSTTCELQMGSQTGLGPVNFIAVTNTPTERNDITVKSGISKKIAYKVTKDPIGCPLTHLNETRTDGSYTGTITFKGESPETKAEKELFLK